MLLKIQEPGLVFECVSNILLPADDIKLRQLYSACKRMNDIVSIQHINIIKQPSNEYFYVITLTDLRKWKQDIFMNLGNEPTMTFNVSDQWKLSEFALQRDIRDLVIDLIIRFDLTKFEVQWS